jgi:hypothetical protein
MWVVALFCSANRKKTRMSGLNNVHKRETSLSLSLSIVAYVRIDFFHSDYSSYIWDMKGKISSSIVHQHFFCSHHTIVFLENG